MTDDGTTTADGDGGRTVDDRMAAIESTQAEQGSKLDKILELLPGGHDGDDGDDQGAGDPAPAGRQNIGAEVRRQIAEADARARAEARDKEHGDWRQSVEDRLESLKPEQAPREPQTGVRGRLQRALLGKQQ